MKKILTVVLLWTALYGTAFSQNASDFTVNAEGVITKYTGFDTVVVIPAVIGGKNITGIGYEAFLRADLTKVTIPEGVLEIGRSAFNGNKLTAITIPNSVTEIGREAFANNRLTSVTIPGSVKTIRDGAFKGNTAFAKIVISEGVRYIYSEAFANTKCTSVSLPSTITILEDSFDLSAKPSFTLAANIPLYDDYIPVFISYIANDRKAGTYASNLSFVEKKTDDYGYLETRYGVVLYRYWGDSTRVRIPAMIGGVPVKALYGNFYSGYFFGTFESGEQKLAAVQIPEGITYIGPRTFKENELTNVTIPNSVTFIGPEAFSKCTNLTSVNIPNSVTFIGNGAFSRCTSLTSIIIPKSVTFIGKEAFSNTSLASVTFEGTITSNNFDEKAFGGYDSYIGDLREKYLAGGVGTYIVTEIKWDGKRVWTKQ